MKIGLIVLGVVVLLVKESILRAHLKRRSLKGEKLEHVLLVGPPQDVERFLQEVPPEFNLEIEIVGRIDISRQPIGDLVTALREKNVERSGISASGVWHYRFAGVPSGLISVAVKVTSSLPVLASPILMVVGLPFSTVPLK